MVHSSTVLDDLLQDGVAAGVPGIVAAVTDRSGATYTGSAGLRALGESQAMTQDTVFGLFSLSKPITGTACLQLVEDGELDLDAPAVEYAPAIGELQVLDGFETDGAPRLRSPRSQITTRQLLVHTAGFAYDAFNENYLRLATEHGQPNVSTATPASLRTPLLFDPGTAWEYGTSVDWAGQVVEGITGKRLGAVFQDRIFEPLAMTSSAFTLTDDMRRRKASMHLRDENDDVAVIDFEPPVEPEVHMGGHGLWSTVPDYLRFMRMWLNEGRSDDGQVLRPETISMASRNHLDVGASVKRLPGLVASVSHDVDFFPGTAKSWALTFLRNDEAASTGRQEGSLSWAGMANLYFWIDPNSGIAGVWASQYLPFVDPAAIANYLDFETAVYAQLDDANAPLRRP